MMTLLSVFVPRIFQVELRNAADAPRANDGGTTRSVNIFRRTSLKRRRDD